MVKPASQPPEAPTTAPTPNGAAPAPAAPGDSFPVPGTPEWGKMNRRRAELIHKKVYSSLTPEEEAEFEYLQRMTFAAIDALYPLPPSNFGELQKWEAELRGGRSDTP